MKSSGTIYVGATFALLAAYFSYQWWFNPSRALKRQMGEVAAALSVPAGESDVARIARLAQLGRHLADNVRVRAGDAEISSRDAILRCERLETSRRRHRRPVRRHSGVHRFREPGSGVHVGGGGDTGSAGRAAGRRSPGSGCPSRETGRPVADYERGVEGTTATPVIIRPEM
jgi:hypothetical protein